MHKIPSVIVCIAPVSAPSTGNQELLSLQLLSSLVQMCHCPFASSPLWFIPLTWVVSLLCLQHMWAEAEWGHLSEHACWGHDICYWELLESGFCIDFCPMLMLDCLPVSVIKTKQEMIGSAALRAAAVPHSQSTDCHECLERHILFNIWSAHRVL